MSLRLGLTLVLVSLLAPGCTAKAEQPVQPADAKPCIADFRKKLDEDPTKCAHVWEQIGVHPYQRMLNGIPNVELCTITRCSKCGLVRHECQRHRGR